MTQNLTINTPPSGTANKVFSCCSKVVEGCDNLLSDSEIEKFLVIARSVGTFARALDCSSSVKQPSLHMSAAAASRDVTLFHAHNLLHKHNYDLVSQKIFSIWEIVFLLTTLPTKLSKLRCCCWEKATCCKPKKCPYVHYQKVWTCFSFNMRIPNCSEWNLVVFCILQNLLFILFMLERKK